MPSRRQRRQTGPLYRAIVSPNFGVVAIGLQAAGPSSRFIWRLAMSLPLISRRHDLFYTRLRFGGRHPLCGIGVTSRITRTSSPAAASARIADSRPDPGPLTRTSTDRMPWSRAWLAAFIAACCAANGVPFREPRKPSEPELFQETTLPSLSVMVMMVLLTEAWMCASPKGTFIRAFFLNVFFLPVFFSGAAAPAAAAAFAMIMS